MELSIEVVWLGSVALIVFFFATLVLGANAIYKMGQEDAYKKGYKEGHDEYTRNHICSHVRDDVE